MNVTRLNIKAFLKKNNKYMISATSMLLSCVLFSGCSINKNVSIDIEKDSTSIEMLENTETNKRELIDERYIVVGGDTLSDIALDFNLTEEDLIKVNNLKDNKIYPGLVLVVPSKEDIMKIYELDIPSEPIIEEVPTKEEILEEKDYYEGKKLVALTFDDGPSVNTSRLIDILEANNAKATFFVLGSRINDYKDEIKKMVDTGNQIGNHGYSHKSFTKMSLSDIKDELYATNELLFEQGVMPSKAVRPPYGNLNESIKCNIDNPFILWSVDTRDWESKNKDSVKKEIKANIKEGSIVIMHDLYSTTVDAIEEVLPELTKEGYAFVTIDEMYKYNNIELEKGKVYTMIKKQD